MSERDTALSQADLRRVTVLHVSGRIFAADCPPLGLYYSHNTSIPGVIWVYVRIIYVRRTHRNYPASIDIGLCQLWLLFQMMLHRCFHGWSQRRLMTERVLSLTGQPTFVLSAPCPATNNKVGCVACVSRVESTTNNCLYSLL